MYGKCHLITIVAAICSCLPLGASTPLTRHNPVQGQPFRLPCPVPLRPKPDVYWVTQHPWDPSVIYNVFIKIHSPFNHDRISLFNDGSLYFSKVEPSDVGQDMKYVCYAKYPDKDDPIALAQACLY